MAKQPSSEMPFLDHLEELRWRLIWSLAAFMVGVIIGFVLLMQMDIIGVLERPILPHLDGRKLVYTHPGDPFRIVLSMSLVLGVVLAAPVIVYQLWSFLAPALYKHERRIVIPVFLGGTLLFLGGVAMAYFVALPLTLGFLMNFQAASLEPMITAADYFSFATSMALAFGLVFELPIVIVALTALGVVTPQLLNRYRRHAVVACAVIAALITPGDLISTTIALAIPLYLLYELSVVLSIAVYRRRVRRDAAAAGERVATA
jgi:sec-independent protein translocase protein TatC